MEKTTLISEMQKFHFGSKIFCSDGEEGLLTHVGFAENDSRRVNAIGIRLGRLFGRTVYLPFTAVVRASGEGVTLNITCAELTAASSTVPGGILFDQRSTVQRAQGSPGSGLVLIAVEPADGELSYIVARNLRPGQDTLLRQEYIQKLQPGRMLVAIEDEDLQALPPYRSDAELQREVEDILFDLTPLHVDFRGMRVRVLDSVLYLDGNISSSLRGEMVQDQAQGVQGLLEIENRLVGDDTLAGDLALALARDLRTGNLPIGVYPKLGTVRLSGSVHTAEQKATAGEIASSFPGVRSVINDLVINPAAAMLHVMSAAEKGRAEDIVPGKYIRHTK
ncbi:MAG: BON domain-containing protein [Ktedonobacteraceae bacterium]|nr:BON domain-containing protein [Ktedonobacteraceae bacterium]